MSVSDWENVKENILPLKTGRDPNKLSCFTTKSNVELEKEKQEFEEMISNYQGDDPIDNWLKYTKWIQQSYPGGNMKTELIVVLERCTKLFVKSDKYKNDPRYLRLWITYADMCKDPIMIFSYLENQKIGYSLSLLYEAKAIVYENKGDYHKADQSFQQGIQRRSQPLERLQQKHSDFERRLIARMKQQQFQQQQQGDDQSSSSNENSGAPIQRSALGTITSSTVTSERKSAPLKGQPIGMNDDPNSKKRKSSLFSSSIGGAGKSNSGFQIFDDESGVGEDVQTNSKFVGTSKKNDSQLKWDELEPELTRHKENSQIPQKWSEVKITQKKLKSSSTPSFEIYQDQDLNTSTTDSKPVSPNKLKSLSTTKLSQFEQIHNNPLANFPTDFSSSTSSTTAKSGSSSNSGNSSSSIVVKKGNEKIGYKKSLFMVGSDEISFEQYRSKLYLSKIKQQKEQKEQQEKQEQLREQKEKKEQQEINESKMLIDEQPSKQKDNDIKSKFYSESKPTPPSPTMTIHTKLALNDVVSWFNVPLDFEKNNNKITTVPNSPSPFSNEKESTIFSQQPSIKNQENLEPLPPKKITNGDILKNKPIAQQQQHQQQQLYPQPDYGDEEEEEENTGGFGIHDRERIDTMDRIDQFVKNDKPMFSIYQDPTTTDQNPINPTSNPALDSTLTEKFKVVFPLMGENSEFGGGNNSKPFSTKKTTSFTIFEDPPTSTASTTTPFSSTTNGITSSSLSLSSISNISSQTTTTTTEDKSNTTQNITQNLTQNLTTVIFINLTPDNGIVNPYDIEHTYLLEQHVSNTVQYFENFANCSQDIAPLSTTLEQANKDDIFEVGSNETSIDIGVAVFNATKCLGHRTTDSTIVTLKVERIDQPEDSFLTLKIQDPPSIWEFYIGNQIQTRLENALQNIDQDMINCLMNRFIKFRSLFFYADRSILLMDYLEQGSLKDVVSALPLEEGHTIYFVIEILRMVDLLHRNTGIIHGSITPGNLKILNDNNNNGNSNWSDWTPNLEGAWKTKGLTLINYSKCIDTTLYSKGAKFSLNNNSSNTTSIDQVWLQSRNDSNWSFDLDYLGIAQTIFYLLSGGKSLELCCNSSKLEPSNINLVKKTYQSSINLWNHTFNILLNTNPLDNNDNTSNNILLNLQKDFETYLISNPSISKSIKNSLRKQNIKVYDYLQSLQ
eukprot:gene4997-6221_t